MLMIINFINKFNMKKIILTILSIIFLQTNVFSFPISAVAFKKCNSHLLITVNECKVKQKYSKGIKEPEIRPENEYYLNPVEQNISLFADIDLMSVSNTVNGIIAKIVSGSNVSTALTEQANINVAESYSNIGNPQERLADLVFSNSLVESANNDLDDGRYITGTIKGLIATSQTALIFTGLGESVAGMKGYAVATNATTIAENITTKEIASTVGKVENVVDTSKYLGKDVAEIKLLPQTTTKNPWLQNAEIISIKTPKDCYINMALAPGQNRPGAWGTFDNITSIDYVRNKLAVTPEFKPQISYVQKYLIPKGTRIQIGIVGSQEYNGIIYLGGGTQVQILNYMDRLELIPIGDKIKIK